MSRDIGVGEGKGAVEEGSREEFKSCKRSRKVQVRFKQRCLFDICSTTSH